MKLWPIDNKLIIINIRQYDDKSLNYVREQIIKV